MESIFKSQIKGLFTIWWNQWYDQVSLDQRPVFERNVGFTESFEEDFIQDFSSKNNISDKSEIIYDREYILLRNKKVKELAKIFFEKRMKDFQDQISSKTKIVSNKILCRRVMTISEENALESLKNGKPIGDFTGLGIYWSWDLTKAAAHWGIVGEVVNLDALIPIDGIDLKETLLMNLHPSFGEDEAEIRVIEGTEIELVAINTEPLENHIIFKA